MWNLWRNVARAHFLTALPLTNNMVSTLSGSKVYASIPTCETLRQNERFFWKGQIYIDGKWTGSIKLGREWFFTNVVIETENGDWLILKRHKNTANYGRKLFPETKEIDNWKLILTLRNSWHLFIFSIWLFSHDHWRITGQQEKGEGIYCLNSSRPCPPALQTLAVAGRLLQIAHLCTQLTTGLELGSFVFQVQVADH